MSVNLIQIQERLKDVPMQSIMQYANGGNPQVPPFMALSELNRRKQMQQNAQPAQAPQGTVKDHIEQEVAGMAGMAAPGQMPGQQPGQPAPQGMPQGAPQGMPQGAPQMAPPQAPPVRAAEGGLMSLPVRDFEFGSGGIVAFARGDEVNDETATDPEEDPTQLVSMNLAGDLKQYQKMMRDKMAEKVPETLSPLAMEKKMAEEDPEQYGILRAKPGAEYLKGIEAQLQARNSEAERQRAENAKLKELQTYGLLAKAANSTRGMTGGIGSQIAQMLGSFGQGYAGVEEKAVSQEQALRDDLLKRQELQNAAKFEVEKLQRAQAEGDVKGEYMHKANLEKLQNALSISQNSMLKTAMSGAYGAAAKQNAANIAAEARIKAEQIKAAADRATANKADPATEILNRAMALEKEGKVAEAKQMMDRYIALKNGTTPDMRRAQLIEKFTNDWAKLKPLQVIELKKQGIDEETWVRNKVNMAEGAAPAAEKSITMADIETTAKNSGKSIEEVMKAAKAKGFAVK